MPLSARISISPKEPPSPEPGSPSPRRRVSLIVERHRVRHTLSVDLRLLQLLLLLATATGAAGYVVTPTSFSQPRAASAGRLASVPVMSAAGPSEEYKEAWGALHKNGGSARIHPRSAMRVGPSAEMSAQQGKQPTGVQPPPDQDLQDGMANERTRPRSPRGVVEMSAAQAKAKGEKRRSGPSDEYKRRWEAMHKRTR